MDFKGNICICGLCGRLSFVDMINYLVTDHVEKTVKSWALFIHSIRRNQVKLFGF